MTGTYTFQRCAEGLKPQRRPTLVASYVARGTEQSAMPRCTILMLTVLLMALTACGLSQGIPRYDDVEGARRVMVTLSPWNDGSPDRSNDGRTVGEPKSDRQVFARWFQRYYENEVLFQHDRNYQTFNKPSTVAEAIQQQRQYEAKQEARQAAADEQERTRAAARREEKLRQKTSEADEQSDANIAVPPASPEQSPAAKLETLRQSDTACLQRRATEEDRLRAAGRTPAGIARLLITMPCPGDPSLW